METAFCLTLDSQIGRNYNSAFLIVSENSDFGYGVIQFFALITLISKSNISFIRSRSRAEGP